MLKFSNCPATVVQMREGEVLMKMLIRSLGVLQLLPQAQVVSLASISKFLITYLPWGLSLRQHTAHASICCCQRLLGLFAA